MAAAAGNRHTLPEYSTMRYNGDTVEIWRPVVGYDGYDVSSLGRVRSWRKGGWGGKKLHKPLIKSQKIDAIGRRTVTLYLLCVRSSRRVHQLVLEAFVGPRKKGFETRHLDGNPANNKVENLKWGTHFENIADTIRHGMVPRGEMHCNATLTESQARKILTSKESAKALAKRYKVSEDTVRRIKAGRRWKHIQPVVPA